MTRKKALEFAYKMRKTKPELSGPDIARLLGAKGYKVTDRTVNIWLKQAYLSRDTQTKIPGHIIEDMRFMWGFGRTCKQIAEALAQNYGISMSPRRVWHWINWNERRQQGQLKEAAMADESSGDLEGRWWKIWDRHLKRGRSDAEAISKMLASWTRSPIAKTGKGEQQYARIVSLPHQSKKSKAA